MCYIKELMHPKYSVLFCLAEHTSVQYETFHYKSVWNECSMLSLHLTPVHLFSLGDKTLILPESSANIDSSIRVVPGEQPNSFLTSGVCIFYTKLEENKMQQVLNS